MKNLNKISLYQEGGAMSDTSVDPAIADIVQAFNSEMEKGADPQEIVLAFLQQGVPQEILSQVLDAAGFQPGQVIELMQNVEILSKQQNEQMQQPEGQPQQEGMQMPPEMMDSQAQGVSSEQMTPNDMASLMAEAGNKALTDSGMVNPEMQFGGPFNQGPTVAGGPLQNTFNSGSPRAVYLPYLPKNPDFVSAIGMLDDAVGSLAGNRDRNGDGLMDGAFRDLKTKRERFRENSYKNNIYKVELDPNDPNQYVRDYKDIADGKLRTRAQYDQDVQNNSRLNFNTETDKYDGYTSSRPIDSYKKSLFTEDQLAKYKSFDEKGVSLNDFMGRLNDEDRQMLAGVKNYPKGVTLGIDKSGVGKSYLNKQDNPYYYDTMMGLNRTARPGENKQTGPQIPQSVQDALKNFRFKDGGDNDDLRKAQYAFETGDNPFMAYLKSMGKTNYINDSMVAADGKMQTAQPTLGATPYDTEVQKAIAAKPATSTTPSFNAPKITKQNNLGSFLNKAENFVENNPDVQAFGAASEFAVAGANLANQFFEQDRFNKLQDQMRTTTMADKVYSTVVDPVNKRGTWDINSGLAEEDNLTTYLNAGKYGKEIYQDGGQIMDVDMKTLTELIAAGADIKIL